MYLKFDVRNMVEEKRMFNQTPKKNSYLYHQGFTENQYVHQREDQK